MSDLRKLIEAAENGTLDAQKCGEFGKAIVPYCNGDTITLVTPLNAFNDDMNAALALFEALLPGWAIERMAAWPGSPCRVSLWGTHELGGERWHKFEDGRIDAEGPTPARALLLAVLRAKLMETSHA